MLVIYIANNIKNSNILIVKSAKQKTKKLFKSQNLAKSKKNH